MTFQLTNTSIAIVGVGPRGLYAVEQLFNKFSNLSPESNIQVTLFEPSVYAGSGNTWRVDQPDSNWLNISVRALRDLKGRKEFSFKGVVVPSFPSYSEWSDSEKNSNIDYYPPRKKLGAYLHERFKSFSKNLLKTPYLHLKPLKIEDLDYADGHFKLTDSKGDPFHFNEVLLTIGHQPTKTSKEILKWQHHAEETCKCTLYPEAYPTERLIKSNKISSDSKVGIRGFGLSMIDILRALTCDRGGKFLPTDDDIYKYLFEGNDRIPYKIVPFSLDGLPLVPKPLGEKIDNLFRPTQEEKNRFFESVRKVAQSNTKVEGNLFLSEAMAPIAVRVYLDLKKKRMDCLSSRNELYEVAVAWLDYENYRHRSLLKADTPTLVLIEKYVSMALDLEPISFDYCMGQVWRHLQSLWYQAFSHSSLPHETIASVIKLHERIKRYSYGPPIESMQQLLALIDADIVDLDYIKDPKVELVQEGWSLQKENQSVIVDVMINSVLDSPKVLEVSSPLVVNLLKHELIKPVHSELGIDTYENALVKRSKNDEKISLAVLGRLSKGSVVGVDAILECFGKRIEDWAEGVLERLGNRNTDS